MAPARMVAFMEEHISQCEECQADPDVKLEAEKIREIVLPPSKVPKPKVVRVPKEEVNEAQKVDKAHVAGEEDVTEEKTSEDEAKDEDIDSDGEDIDDGDEDDGDEDDDKFDPDVMDEDEEI